MFGLIFTLTGMEFLALRWLLKALSLFQTLFLWKSFGCILRKQAHTFSFLLFWFFSRLARHPLKRNTDKTAEPLCAWMYFIFSTERQVFQLTLWADNIIELHGFFLSKILINFENRNILPKEGSKLIFLPSKTRCSARRDERQVTNPDLSLLEI